MQAKIGEFVNSLGPRRVNPAEARSPQHNSSFFQGTNRRLVFYPHAGLRIAIFLTRAVYGLFAS